jgi:hypothetical protein
MIVERLARLMDPTYIAVWLRKPVPALDGRGWFRTSDLSRVKRPVSDAANPATADQIGRSAQTSTLPVRLKKAETGDVLAQRLTQRCSP